MRVTTSPTSTRSRWRTSRSGLHLTRVLPLYVTQTWWLMVRKASWRCCVRFGDFLRTAILLFAGAATACAVVAIAGVKAKDDNTLLYVAVGWWLIATLIGLWLGRGANTLDGIATLLA